MNIFGFGWRRKDIYAFVDRCGPRLQSDRSVTVRTQERILASIDRPCSWCILSKVNSLSDENKRTIVLRPLVVARYMI
jgi:hypothetical protein